MANHYLMSEQHEDILTQIQPLHGDEEHILPEYAGQEFLHSSTFKNWTTRSADNTTFLYWVEGDAGSGKTALAASVVEDLRRQYASDQTVGIAYVYCGHRSPDGYDVRTTNDVFASLALQLIPQVDRLPGWAVKGTHREKHLWVENTEQYDNLGAILRLQLDEFCEALGCVFFVIDGIDCLSQDAEANTVEEVVGCLFARDIGLELHSFKNNIPDSCGPRLRVLITSRPDCFDSLAKRPPGTTLRVTYNPADTEVEACIASTLGDRTTWIENDAGTEQKRECEVEGRLASSSPVRSQTYSDIWTASGRNPLAASLLARALRSRRREEAGDASDATVFFQGLPASTPPLTLNATYAVVFGAIRSMQGPTQILALRAIGWLAAARMALKMDTLRHMLGVVDWRVMDTKVIENEIELPAAHDILQSSCGLIVLDHHVGIVRLANTTLKDYIMAHEVAVMEEAEKEITAACLAILGRTELDTGHESSASACTSNPSGDLEPTSTARHIVNPEIPAAQISEGCPVADSFQEWFRGYAERHWESHMGSIQDARLEELALRYLKSKYPAWGAEGQPTDEQRDNHSASISDGGRDGRTTAILVAVRAGLDRLLGKLLKEQPREINVSDGETTPLHAAVDRQNHHAVQLLINSGAAVNILDDEGSTPLYHASVNGDLASTKLLLSNGASPDIRYMNGWSSTPLQEALRRGHHGVAEELLLHGADLHASPARFGVTALGAAFSPSLDESSRTRAVSLLLKHGLDIEREQDEQQELGNVGPLYWAMDANSLDMVRMLLAAGADVEEHHPRNRRTILQQFLHRGSSELLQILLDHGADPWVHDDTTKEIPIEEVLHRISTARLLLPVTFPLLQGAQEKDQGIGNEGRLQTGISGAKQNNRDQKLGSLIGKLLGQLTESSESSDGTTLRERLDLLALMHERMSSPPSWSDDHGRSLLHLAAISGSTDATHFLLQRGHSPDTRDADGLLPLHHASQNSSEQLVRLLLEHGADVDSASLRGETALHFAVSTSTLRAETTNAVSVLLSKGCILEARAEDGSTPLLAAAALGRWDQVRQLIKAGAQLSSHTVDGETALHHAVRTKNLEVSCLLLDLGVERDAQSRNCGTALHLAARLGYETIFKELVQRGADPRTPFKGGNQGYDPLHQNDTPPKLNWLPASGKAGWEGGEPQLVTRVDNIQEGWMACHSAASGGHVSILQLLHDQDVELTTQTADGMTPLHIAAAKERVDALEFLLANGAEPTCTATNGDTPLHLSSEKWYHYGLDVLVQAGANLTAENLEGRTPLAIAAATENYMGVKALLATGVEAYTEYLHERPERFADMLKDSARAPSRRIFRLLFAKFGELPVSQEAWNDILLAACCVGGNISIAEVATERGAVIQHISSDEIVHALRDAVARGRLALVELLIAHHVDVHSTSEEGLNALHISCDDKEMTAIRFPQRAHESADMATALLDAGARINFRTRPQGETALHLAVRSCNPALVNVLLRHDASANARDAREATPLHEAVRDFVSADIIEALVRSGALVSAQDWMGETVVHTALHNRGEGLYAFETLLQYQPDLSVRNKIGDSVLHCAVHGGSVDCVKRVLLCEGVSITDTNSEGTTALHIASDHGHTDVVSLLLESGANGHAVNSRGCNPLHNAAQHGNHIIVRKLLEHDASFVNIPTLKEQLTPLHLAVKARSVVTVKRLLRSGASLHAKDREGQSSIALAESIEAKDILRVLVRRVKRATQQMTVGGEHGQPKPASPNPGQSG